MNRDLGQRTRWLNPDAVIDSQYGRVSILVWLTKEADRMRQVPGRFIEIRETTLEGAKKVALFVN